MSDVSEVWRRLHNLIAAGDTLLELRDIYDAAKGTEARIAALRDEHLTLEQAVAALRADQKALDAAYANLDALYKGKLAEAEAAHGSAVTRLTEQEDARRGDVETALVRLDRDLAAARAAHAVELDRLAATEAARRRTIDGLDVQIVDRQTALDGLRREAARILKGD